MMKPERWQQIELLYHAALERESEARAAFLDEACAGNAELRHEVESLLAFDERAAHFIAQPAVGFAAEAFADEQSTMQLGQRISHYQLLSRLGKGGMGEVYLAQDTSLKRQVALKLLPAKFTADSERVRRFAQEARTASALNHPNILTIHEIGRTDETHFIVTEHIDGQTLRQQMKTARMKLPDILDIAIQIANALAAAHAAGIIHRDIKPENVMLRQDGIVKVLDFGLAKLTEQTSGEEADSHAGVTTESGVVMGTPRYMSPEQAQGQKVDVRTDIFSLGVMLYEMIAGRRPFEGATISEVMAAILRDEPPPLSQHLPDCPVLLERIVNQCLAKTPERRYQTAAELSAELKAARSTIEQGSRPTTAEEEKLVAFQRTEKSPNHWRRWGVIAAAVALIAVIVSLYYFRTGRNTAETPIKTIAVLPLRPLQSGARDETLELGTTSTLITRLGSLRQLIVRSESAVEKYASHEQDPLTAGREQKVDAVLDSRYQRVGDKLRFRLRLLRVADGATLWADTLDQQTADPFAIEDALSAKVTSALRLTLSSADKELLAKRYTNSAEAWQLYVRGRQLLHKRGVPNIEKGITYFQQAIALDNSFALAHATLGFSYLSLNWVGYPPAKELMPQAKMAFAQALKLDDQLAEAHTYLASYKDTYEWDFDGAEQEHRRAIDLNSNSADAHHHYALHLAYMGRFEQAIAEIRKAEELDPTDLFINRSVAMVLFLARRYDEAIKKSRQATDLNPNWGAGYVWLRRAYETQGNEQEVFAVDLKQAEANSAGPEEIAEIKAAFAAGGLKGCRRRELDHLLEQEKSGYVTQYDVAMHYAQLGNKEQALARLQKAVDDRNIGAAWLNVEPIWDSYRTDPRFVALVRRVGLAP